MIQTLRRDFPWKTIVASLALFFALHHAPGAHAGDASFTNLLLRGENAIKSGNAVGGLKFYSEARKLAGANSADLCALAKYYCESMRDTSARDTQKTLVDLARECSVEAIKSAPKSATAHLSLAIVYGRSLGYVDNETKVKWSKAMKTECETTLALDPNQDVAYYLLGRWNFGTANLNFILRGWVRIVYGGLPAASNQEAIKDFKKAIQLAPNRIIHHAGLAAVYEAMGDRKLQIAELEKCRSLKPFDREDAEEEKDVEKKLAELHK